MPSWRPPTRFKPQLNPKLPKRAFLGNFFGMGFLAFEHSLPLVAMSCLIALVAGFTGLSLTLALGVIVSSFLIFGAFLWVGITYLAPLTARMMSL